MNKKRRLTSVKKTFKAIQQLQNRIKEVKELKKEDNSKEQIELFDKQISNYKAYINDHLKNIRKNIKDVKDQNLLKDMFSFFQKSHVDSNKNFDDSYETIANNCIKLITNKRFLRKKLNEENTKRTKEGHDKNLISPLKSKLTSRLEDLPKGIKGASAFFKNRRLQKEIDRKELAGDNTVNW